MKTVVAVARVALGSATSSVMCFFKNVSAIAVACLVTSGLAGSVRGDTFTWDGGGSDGNFSTAANWSGSAPVGLATHSFQFGALASPFQSTANVDLTGNPDSFVFQAAASAMTITGNALQFANSSVTPITNSSANLQTFSNQVRQFWSTASDRTWNGASGNLSFNTVVLRGDLSATSNRNLVIDGAFDTTVNGTITMAGFTSGGGSIIKRGAGLLTFKANSTMDTTTVDGGTLRLEGGTLTTSKETVASSSIGIRLESGTLQVAGGNINAGSHGLGSFSTDVGTLNMTLGTVTLGSSLVVGWNSSPTFDVTGGDLTASAVIHKDGGSGVLNIGDTGVVTADDVNLSAAGSGTDSLTVNLNTGGALVADQLFLNLTSNAITTGTHSLNVNFDGGTLRVKDGSSATLISAVPGGGSTQAINVVVKAGGAIIETNGRSVSILQPILPDSALGVTPDGGLTKDGVGTLTLAASTSNTYTGATTISAGTLLLNGTHTGGAGYSIASGATLGGSGSTASALSVSGIIAPGNSIGTLDTGTVTWNGAAAAGSATDWLFELGASNTADLLNITGDFDGNTGGGSVFRFDFAGSTDQGTFDLVTWSGTTTFVTPNTEFTFTNLGGGNTGSFQFDGVGNTLQFVVVPEPATMALVGTGVAILGFCLARRRKL